MLITRTSLITGIEHTREVRVTLDQLHRYQAGGLSIQDAFPNLNADDREFILSGITPEEWKEAFPPEQEEPQLPAPGHMKFIKLDLSGEQTFRTAARRDYRPFTPIDGLWHPAYQDECVQINFEHAVFVESKDVDYES